MDSQHKKWSPRNSLKPVYCQNIALSSKLDHKHDEILKFSLPEKTSAEKILVGTKIILEIMKLKIFLHNLRIACFDSYKLIQTLGFYCWKLFKQFVRIKFTFKFPTVSKFDSFLILFISSSHLLVEAPYLVMRNFLKRQTW